MDDQPLTLLRCRPDYPANPLSYPSQTQDLQLLDCASLYFDFRSPARAAHQHFRKRRSPKQRLRESHTLKKPHQPVRPLGHPSHQCNPNPSRGQCTKKHRDPDLSDEAYWDKLAAEWRFEEQRQMMDPVQLYYNFGHGAVEIESLRPAPLTVEEEEMETEGWVDVSLPLSSSPSSPEAEAEGEREREGEDVQTVETPLWTLSIPQPPSPLSEEPRNTSHTCTFTYHRNASGLWELGYAAPHYVPNTCAPSVLLVACTLSNPGARECSCAEFEAVDGWRAPDEVWRGRLVEWMSEDEGAELGYADARYACDMQERRRAEWQTKDSEAAKRGGGLKSEWVLVRQTRSRGGWEAEWDVVSEVSSTGSWRVVDAW